MMYIGYFVYFGSNIKSAPPQKGIQLCDPARRIKLLPMDPTPELARLVLDWFLELLRGLELKFELD